MTTIDKNVYFKGLRDRWNTNKALAEADKDAMGKYEAMQKESPSGISYYGYYFCMQSMKAQGLDGVPYLDCKTFHGWKLAGFIVKKGEHAKIDGITWIAIKDKDGKENNEYVYPKVYKLFHRSQVEELK